MAASMQTVIARQLKAARQHLHILQQSPALQSPTRYLSQRRDALKHIHTSLISSQQRAVSMKRQQFVSLTAKLDAMSPLKVLTRGYSMLCGENGNVIRSVRLTSVGNHVTVLLSDGKMDATINEISEDQL